MGLCLVKKHVILTISIIISIIVYISLAEVTATSYVHRNNEGDRPSRNMRESERGRVATHSNRPRDLIRERRREYRSETRERSRHSGRGRTTTRLNPHGHSVNNRPARSHQPRNIREHIDYDNKYHYYGGFSDDFNLSIAHELYRGTYEGRTAHNIRSIDSTSLAAPDVDSHPIYGDWM